MLRVPPAKLQWHHLVTRERDLVGVQQEWIFLSNVITAQYEHSHNTDFRTILHFTSLHFLKAPKTGQRTTLRVPRVDGPKLRAKTYVADCLALVFLVLRPHSTHGGADADGGDSGDQSSTGAIIGPRA